MGFTRIEWMLVDETLAFVKPMLRACRKEHGVAGDVTYAIHYDGTGAIMRIEIVKAPPDLSDAFVGAAIRILGDKLRIPRSTETGVLHFTDLGLEAPPTQALVINGAADAERDAERAVRRKKENRIALAVSVGFGVLYILSIIVGL